MRRAVVLFPLLLLALLAFAIYQVWTLLSLLVVDGRNDEILKSSLPAIVPPKNKDTKLPHAEGRKPIIPKILHQTYINTSIPLVWQEAQKSCTD